MKKLSLLFLLAISLPSFAQEFSCVLENGKSVDLRINEKTVRYAYGKPDDLELVFSISRNKLEFYRHKGDGALLMSLPYGGVRYEFSGDDNGTFLQIVNQNGKVNFKQYCAD